MEAIVEQLESGETMVDGSGEELSEQEFTQLGLALVQHGDQVQSLDLHETGLTDFEAQILAQTFSQMPSLHDLSLCWNHLTPPGLLVLASSFTSNLKDLYLAGNLQLGDLAVEHLKSSGLLGQLEVLDLGECGLGLEGTIILANHLSTSRLRELSLGLNVDIGDDGLRSLCNVLDKSKLESLDVTGCGVTDAGVIPLAIAMNACPCLREIRLNDNDITDGGALLLGQALKQSTVVTVLDLEGNPQVSEEMLQEMYKYLNRDRSQAKE
ncbi:hypothetical protein BASA81_003138 [Batrachochytrium salamandrivorans]|nr:hypothetical protein BASA81_003138 [Batrachochytrium salamandrivorans]